MSTNANTGEVEIEIADGIKPLHKFTDLCREFMWLTSLSTDGTEAPLYNVVMLIVFGIQSRSAVVTYQTNNKEAAVLIKR